MAAQQRTARRLNVKETLSYGPQDVALLEVEDALVRRDDAAEQLLDGPGRRRRDGPAELVELVGDVAALDVEHAREAVAAPVRKKSGRFFTDRPSTRSWSPAMSWGARPATGATFSQPATSAHDFTTSTFFLRESQSVKSSSGRQMASGRPGKPPPVPTSTTRVAGARPAKPGTLSSASDGR